MPASTLARQTLPISETQAEEACAAAVAACLALGVEAVAEAEPHFDPDVPPHHFALIVTRPTIDISDAVSWTLSVAVTKALRARRLFDPVAPILSYVGDEW